MALTLFSWENDLGSSTYKNRH